MPAATGKVVHREHGAHTRPCTHKCGTHKGRSVATAGVVLFKGPQARRYTHKVVHTQGGTHKRRVLATAGVLLLIYVGGGCC